MNHDGILILIINVSCKRISWVAISKRCSCIFANQPRFTPDGAEEAAQRQEFADGVAALLSEKKAAYTEYREAREEMKRLLVYRANAEQILGIGTCETEKKKEREQR